MKMALEQQIQKKYADKVTPEHTAAMQAIGLFHAMIGQHRETMQKLIDSDQYMQNIGSLIDPTLYRDALYSRSLKQQLRLVNAALAFLKEVDAVKAEIEGEPST